MSVTLMPCGLLCLVLHFCPWFHFRTQAINKTLYLRWTLSHWYLIHNSDWTPQIPPCTWIGDCKILQILWRGVHSLVIISFHQQRSKADFFFNLICGNNANNDALLFLLTFRGDPSSFECLKCLPLHRCRSSCINGQLRRLWLAPYECLIGHHLLCSHCQWTIFPSTQTETWRMFGDEEKSRWWLTWFRSADRRDIKASLHTKSWLDQYVHVRYINVVQWGETRTFNQWRLMASTAHDHSLTYFTG